MRVVGTLDWRQLLLTAKGNAVWGASAIVKNEEPSVFCDDGEVDGESILHMGLVGC